MEVIYEDNQIVVVIKPQNILTQGDKTGDIDLLTQVKEYVKEKYNKKGEAFIGMVQRLDRPTGGVIVFARNSKSASRLTAQMQNNEFEKTYYAVVKGVPKKPKARLENYLRKDPVNNKVTLATMAEKDARLAILEYEVIDTKDGLSLLKIRLETGRSHQIRVQLANIGCPIYGDAKYGDVGKEKNAVTTNLALWATGLEFRHPTLDQMMIFKVNPPEEKYPYSLFNFD